MPNSHSTNRSGSVILKINQENQTYLLKKEVYWSMFQTGMTIEQEFQEFFVQNEFGVRSPGQFQKIEIMIDGQIFNAKLVNVNFDRKKYKDHKRIVQIRYAEKSPIATFFRQRFEKSFQYLQEQRMIKSMAGDKSLTKLPDDKKEYLALYATDRPNLFIGDCITCDDRLEAKKLILNRQPDEWQFENLILTETQDPNAEIIKKEGLVKIRKLDRKIGDTLKKVYDFRCRICGEKIGDLYQTHVAEAHHIRYFTESLNNDMNNMLIVCPNHHRIIHQTNPIFDFEKKEYTYPNGLREGLVFNKHL